MEKDGIEILKEKWHYNPCINSAVCSVPMTEKQSEYIHRLLLKANIVIVRELQAIIYSDLIIAGPLRFKHGENILENQCTKSQATFVIQSLINSKKKPKKQTPKKSVVYFIQEEQGAIKIGKTTDIKKRLSTMQSAHAKRLHLLGIIYSEKMSEREQEIHKLFEQDRLLGEWFAPSAKLMNFINKFTCLP